MDPKIAIVHDWLIEFGGAEVVLRQLLDLFPQADLFTVVSFPDPTLKSILADRPIKPTFIQRLPFARLHHRLYLPLMPIAIEKVDLSSYDIVLSSSYAVAKGVITGPDQLHISYVHSPIRYAWDLQYQYLKESGLDHGLAGYLAQTILHYMRLWDIRTANGVDHFIANSNHVARRIKKVYRRESKVIYPPVSVERFRYSDEKDDFYLTVSRFVPYKRIDLIVKAFSMMPNKRLIVIGEGPEYKKIKHLATSNVTLLGFRPFEEVREHMQNARAFVFTAEEDFGIVAVEAQACGTPVIAFGKGGALETVISGITGILFEEQTIESIIHAVAEFEILEASFDRSAIRKNAERFSSDRFRAELSSFVDSMWTMFQNSSEGCQI